MAGGRGNNKQSGNLDRIHQWLCCHQLYASVKPELPSSETFKKYQRVEESRIVTKSLNELQDNILSIFTDSLYCDFNIIHGHNIIRTNQCIVKTRAPHFYKILKPHFVYINKHIDCIIDKLEIFHHIEGFVRLLYSNSHFSKEEQLLVELILTACTTKLVNAPSANKVLNTDKRYVDCTTPECHSKSIECSRDVSEYATVDVSPTISDMADSGLETGSVSPHENTTSENSSTDFEELQVTEYTSGNDDLDKIRARRMHNKDKKVVIDNERYNSTNNYNSSCHIKDLAESGLMERASNDHSATCCSFDTEQSQLDSSSSSTENAQKAKLHTDEIYQYENQVLSDPFYESDCGSDENESFEFVNPDNASSVNINTEKKLAKEESAEKSQDEKICHSSYSQVETAQSENANHNDTQNPKSSCNTSNYYFIDASTLNDEVEVPTTSIIKNQCYGEKSQPYASYTSKYAATTSNDSAEEQCYKFTPLKTTNLQSGHEKIAEFERELKLTEYLEPLTDTRKIRRTDSMSEEKVSAETHKESLAVEIKEADSGESAHPSPCPDNNKIINNDRHVTSRVHNDNVSNVAVDTEKETAEQGNDKDTNLTDDTRRPSLIRRNTFELDSNDEKLSVLRQEYERRQGNLVFQNAIPQYSGHRVDDDSCFIPPDEPSIPISNVLNKFTMDVQIPTGSQYHTMPYLPLDNGKYEVNQTPPENNNSQQSNSRTNMIYPVTKSASDEVVMDYHTESDNGSGNCSTSLPVTLSCIIEKDNRTDVIKKTKCDETTPIISGGVSTSDYSKPTDSPTVRRKTESTPIVSGGSVIMNDPDTRMRPTRMSSSMTAWVVDMSDCNRNESKPLINAHAGMSQSFSSSECVKKPIRKISSHEKHGSLGFFVNLKDMDPKPVAEQQAYQADKKEPNECSKSYCEFYVDMSNTSNTPKNKKLDEEETSVKSERPVETGDKKNIFSMFIDLSDSTNSKENTAQPSHKRSLSTFSDKKVEMKLDDTSSNENSIATRENQLLSEQKFLREKTKQSVFMYIESDSPVVRRRTLSSSRSAFKRHSWNVDKTQGAGNNGHVAKELMFRKEHKRAHSLSVDRGDLKKLQTKPSSSSHSLNDTTKPECVTQKNSKLLQEGNNGPANMDTSSEDVFEFDVRDTPPNSHVEVINEELRVSVKEHEYTELKTDRTVDNLNATDVKYEDEYSEPSAWEKTCTESTEGQTRKSETFDISSGSGPSPDSDNHDYELSELLNGEVPNINRAQVVPAVGSKISETHKSLNETIKKIESELKSPDYVKPETVYDNHNVTSKKNERPLGHNLKSTTSNFVRLSDLDKTPVVSLSTDVLTVKEDRSTYRMCNSIPETSWIESKLVMSRTNGSVRSLPRKFTSLMSTSLPPKQKSPLEELTGEYDGEGIISESDLSSMQSSMGRSGAEGSTEETETSSLAGSRPYNRLGEDLLRMFLEEINPDITIDVAGRRIRAHRCILSSRCQYFAAILSGGWIESVGNVIPLHGYSYDAVHFALCHIYSGESNIPDSISIVELATLADLLCLEGLKEIIGYTLKVKYCHLFHKPCQICAVGVLECMPLAAAYGLDEVYRKSLRWVTRHFVRIWPCKAFATLPKELMAKCYHQHIVHMSTDNVLQTMMDCDKLLATLPNVRWAEPVFRMVSNLLETSVKFLSDNFAGVLGNENFQSLGRELTWNISRLEDNFLAAAERLPPEQACKSYSKLHKMLSSAQQDEAQEKIKWGPLFVDFLKKIQSRVEKCLVRDAARAARTTTWLKMDLELRRRIQELACLVILPNETVKRQSRHSNFLKEPRPASSRSTTTNRSLDLKRVKMVISEHNHKTLKQMAAVQQQQQQQQHQQQQQQQQQPKKVFNKPKSDPLERKMQNDKPATTETNRPKSWPNKLEVKSRYLEPRNKSVPKDTPQPIHPEKVMIQQRRKIMISSSDSSRTSSPAMKRATDKKPLAKIKLPIKKDVKALSSDSLTESNVSRTNTKKDSISKSCGITRPESPSFKQKNTEIGLSVDSLAESKNKPATIKKKTNKMDTSMSTDSLMTEITTTPKSNTSNKLSPTLGKTTNKVQPYDKGAKKNSPPMQQRSPLTVTRRPRRSLECSTAASRSRAAAISAYHLRRNLLDAAKTPDIPSKSLNNVSCKPINTRPVTQSTINHPNVTREKKEGVPNQQGSESPSKRSSPKSSGTNKINKTAVTNKRTTTTTKTSCDEKVKNKCHNGEVPKQPTVGSRSGTFLKDEPTILKKADIKSSQINT
ncbi:BTB/POZ domain-containing protein 8 [Anthophora quadrimaculata]